jgi:hypothetical protein
MKAELLLNLSRELYSSGRLDESGDFQSYAIAILAQPIRTIPKVFFAREVLE